jgi:hypothetical protein
MSAIQSHTQAAQIEIAGWLCGNDRRSRVLAYGQGYREYVGIL